MSDENPFEESGDDRARRGAEYFARLGIPPNLFNFGTQLQTAITAADTATADPQNRPWLPLGARNIGGRIRCLAQDPVNPSTMYAGSAQGGLWRTTDAGDTWTPLGQPKDAVPVGAIAVDPSDHHTVFMATGEPVNSTSAGAYPIGLGIFRYNAVTDAFTTEVDASSAAPQNGLSINYSRIRVDPGTRGRYWVGAQNGLWRRDPPPVASPPGTPPIFTAEHNPAAVLPAGALPPGVVTDFALVQHDLRDATRFDVYACIAQVGIYRGDYVHGRNPPLQNWTPLAGGLPGPGFDRIRFSACVSVPGTLYAIFETPGTGVSLFRSDNYGTAWVPCGNPDPNLTWGWYSMAVEVHPHDPTFVIGGGLDVYRSTNSGANFTQILDWNQFNLGDRGQHSDQHDFLFDRFERHKLWIANDGGVTICPDVVHHNPLIDRTWRQRSHGILAAQFNDITTNRGFPNIMGGGLQDNGSYVGYGGPTWYLLSWGDGGEIAFEVNNPRVMYTHAAGAGANFFSNTIVSSTVATQIRNNVLPENAPPANAMAVQIAQPVQPPNAGLFVGVVEHHPTTPQHMLEARQGMGFVTTNAGGAWAPFLIPPAPGFLPMLAGPVQVSTLAYSPMAPNTDWWCGTNSGDVYSTRDGNATNWVQRLPWPVPAPGAPRPYVSRIIVHPLDNNFIVIATGGDGAGTPAGAQGRVYMSRDRGATWNEITGLAVINGGSGGPAVLRALPQCPVTSLAFDAFAAGSETLFAGTLVGVFALRNIPIRTAAPVAAAAVPGFTPEWRSFNNRVPVAGAVFRGQLPLVLVNDLSTATIGTGVGARQKLRCATYGRGMYECDLNEPVPPGGTRYRLYIRQHCIEDGLVYPRPDPATLNVAASFAGDPRLPAVPAAGSVRFDETHANDIRVDRAPFLFFEEQIDGVEFDENIGVRNLAPGELNIVYVQLLNSGWDTIPLAKVHLYFTTTAAPAPPGTAVPADLPAPAAATFWNPPGFDPAPASAWQRAGKAQEIRNLRPNQPIVARFEWVPPANLATPNVALLALCESTAVIGGALVDPLVPAVAPPPPPATIAALIRNERRAALRIVTADPFVPDVYVRDGVEDRGTVASVAYSGRSPDIIVRQTDVEAANRAHEFRDLLDMHPQDRLKPGTNFIFVRVHNSKLVDLQARVQLWWVKPTMPYAAADANVPPFDETKWSQAGVVGDGPAPPPVTSDVTVPAGGWGVARFTWIDPADPDPGAADAYRAYLLVALVSTVLPGDTHPAKSEANSFEAFWNFLRTLRSSGNAALRGVRWAAP